MPINLLIADDSVTIQKVVDLAFEDEDVNVITAGDGEEALGKVNDGLPDIIIVDTDMPKLNGFEVCQKIKGDAKLKNIAVCLLHSDFEEFDEDKFHSCGADGYLTKPFKSEDIINKVAEITGATNKIRKEEQILSDTFADQENLQSVENPTEDLEELEVLSQDEVEQKNQNGDVIELSLENEVVETDQDKLASLDDSSNQDLSEDEIEKFMEDLDEMKEDELFKESGSEETTEVPSVESEKKLDDGLKQELDEFNKALNISEEEIGKTEPYIPAHDEENEKENEDAPMEIPELESVSDEIKEEKEDLINETGILPDGEFESQEIEKDSANLVSEETAQLISPQVGVNGTVMPFKKASDEAGREKAEETVGSKGTPLRKVRSEDFERLVGGYIKEVIERNIKETMQGEIAGITDKIIEAVERIAREITPDITRTIIQDEIKKLKESNE